MRGIKVITNTKSFRFSIIHKLQKMMHIHTTQIGIDADHKVNASPKK